MGYWVQINEGVWTLSECMVRVHTHTHTRWLKWIYKRSWIECPYRLFRILPVETFLKTANGMSFNNKSLTFCGQMLVKIFCKHPETPDSPQHLLKSSCAVFLLFYTGGITTCPVYTLTLIVIIYIIIVIIYNSQGVPAVANLWYCMKVVFMSSLATSSCSTCFSLVTLGMRWTIRSCFSLHAEYNFYWQGQIKKKKKKKVAQSISIYSCIWRNKKCQDYWQSFDTAEYIYVLWPSGALYLTVACTQDPSDSLFLTLP